ncbi:MAG: [Fe-Fe] hydrogenase large subunit C-terminal domain-containing protein, partial [Candidatus Firestonebacteria bacterium]
AKVYSVSIMPCTAKKFENSRDKTMYSSGYKDVDVTLTTRELARMIKQAGIDLLKLPDSEPDSPMGPNTGAGVIFGATGGVMEAALRTAYNMATGKELEDVNFVKTRGLESIKEAEIDIQGTKIRIAVAHGLSHVEEVLDRVRQAKKEGKEIPYHFIEVMACPGGCVGGGGQPYNVTDALRLKRSAAIYQDDKEKTVRCSHNNPYVQKLYKDFLGKPLGEKSHKLCHTEYKARPIYVR